MWKILHNFHITCNIILLCCGSYHCLEANYKDSFGNDIENIQESPDDLQLLELQGNEENNVDILPGDLVKFILIKANRDEDVRTEDNDMIHQADPLKKRTIRQATLTSGYTSLYPQVPSAPPYGYQSPSQSQQWNGNTQPGYQGYRPTNYTSPYNPPAFNPSQGSHGAYNTNYGQHNPNLNTYNASHGQYKPGYGSYNQGYGTHNTNQSFHYPNQGQYPTQRPSNPGPYNPSNGPYNPSAGLNPYGGYSSQGQYNNSNQRYPNSNYPQNPSHYPGYNPPNNQNYNHIPGQTPYNNSNFYQNPNTPGGRPSQYPQNSNPYGQNSNSFSQYPQSPNYPQNSNNYSQNRNLSYPQYQSYSNH